MNGPELHPSNAELAPLLGVWRGRGEGAYPTIDDFSYNEELTFGHVGKPFVAMSQKTKDATTELPLHAEAGYFRPQEDGSVELLLTQPSGIVEILSGAVTPAESGVEIDLTSTTVVGTPSAKDVSETRRRYVVDGDSLVIDFWMAAVGEPMTHHLTSRLSRA